MFSKIKIENVVYKMSAIFVRSQYANWIACPSLYVWVRNVKEDDDVIKWKHFPRYWPFVPGKFTGHRRGPSENVCSRSRQNWKKQRQQKEKKEEKHIYVNEGLTRFRAGLAKDARSLKNTGNISDIRTMYCKILVKTISVRSKLSLNERQNNSITECNGPACFFQG